MKRSAGENGSGPVTVVIAAGGTGGHVYPALAVAECLRRQAVHVVWLGTTAGLEARVVPRHGFDFITLRVTGLRSGSWRRRSSAPLRFIVALGAARRCLRRNHAALVLGMGGYASAPGALAARLLGLPLVLHEQNAVPGLVNRWLGPWASRVLEAFPGAFPAERRAIHVGNPVRDEILEVPNPQDRLASRKGSLRVLVLGGSQGARILNQVVPQAVAKLKEQAKLAIRHQVGRGNADRTRERYAGTDFDVEVEEFIENMAGAYAWADVVVCRAGALTVAELAAAGAASVLVPFPFAADDHQARNARRMVEAGAALMLPQEDFDAFALSKLLLEFDKGRARVLEMASAARRLAIGDAASNVARHCLEVARA